MGFLLYFIPLAAYLLFLILTEIITFKPAVPPSVFSSTVARSRSKSCYAPPYTGHLEFKLHKCLSLLRKSKQFLCTYTYHNNRKSPFYSVATQCSWLPKQQMKFHRDQVQWCFFRFFPSLQPFLRFATAGWVYLGSLVRRPRPLPRKVPFIPNSSLYWQQKSNLSSSCSLSPYTRSSNYLLQFNRYQYTLKRAGLPTRLLTSANPRVDAS